MAIETTINIHNNILDKIEYASNSLKTSRTDIIIRLFMKVMKSDSKKATVSGSIKYQKCEGKDVWHKFHICLKDNEYEYLLDLRRLLKMSISYLLAYAVKKYLQKIINEKNTDNYYYRNYILIRKINNGIIYWKLFWDIPDNLGKFLQ